MSQLWKKIYGYLAENKSQQQQQPHPQRIVPEPAGPHQPLLQRCTSRQDKLESGTYTCLNEGQQEPYEKEVPRSSTPYNTHKMNKRNVDEPMQYNVSQPIAIKRRKTIEEGKKNYMSCPLVLPPLKIDRPFTLPDSPTKKLICFLDMVKKHEEYLLRSCIVDKFLLAMTLLFLERAGLTAKGFQKDRYFFYSLFLAMEMEEDAVDGLSEMIYYVVGNIPPRSTIPGILSEAEKAWNSRLLKFYSGKNRFWKRLGFNAYVAPEDCAVMVRFFPKTRVLQKTRTDMDLHALQKF